MKEFLKKGNKRKTKLFHGHPKLVYNAEWSCQLKHCRQKEEASIFCVVLWLWKLMEISTACLNTVRTWKVVFKSTHCTFVYIAYAGLATCCRADTKCPRHVPLFGIIAHTSDIHICARKSAEFSLMAPTSCFQILVRKQTQAESEIQ